MSANFESFRLYVLGQGPFHKSGEILILAESGTIRAVERVSLAKVRPDHIEKQVHRLRDYISGKGDLKENDLKALGQSLFDVAVTGRIKEVYNRVRHGPNRLAPMEIIAEDFAIASWPWEYLYDPGDDLFLCQEFHPVTRGLISPAMAQTIAESSPPLRILVAQGATEEQNISAEEELAWITNDIGQLQAKGLVQISAFRVQTPQELDLLLQNQSYDVLHFIGHAGFDEQQNQGMLHIIDNAGEARPMYALDFAQAVAVNSRCLLVFLNACQTAVSGAKITPSRSSIAAALLHRGVPAVVATQAPIPDKGAYYLAHNIYANLANGKSIVEAVRAGRRAMNYCEGAFIDWGIPVLYTSNPMLTPFPAGLAPAVPPASPAVPAPPRALAAKPAGAEVRPAAAAKPRVAVALVDLDLKAGFLPAMAQEANDAQSYYSFRPEFMPVPSGYLKKLDGSPQALVPRLEAHLKAAAGRIAADYVCFLTTYLVAGSEKADDINLFLWTLDQDGRIGIISTCDLRVYARQSGTRFEAALLRLCLAHALSGQWGLIYHPETRGCLFDYDDDRDDILEMLQKDNFDHPPCRKKIKDKKSLQAVDALMRIR